MGKVKKVKHSLGLLYWKMIEKSENIKFNVKKAGQSIYLFIMGFFVHMCVDYDKINQAQSLVVCAHPDDETIFFYSVICEQKPYVLCMSNRGNKTRKKEFESVLQYLDTDGVLLNFPDMLCLKWKWIELLIRLKLKKIKRRCPDIKYIYTHNSKGESGHHHHFAVSRAVQNVFKDKQVFLTSEMQIEKNSLDKQKYDDKKYIIQTLYKSQYKMLLTWCPWFEHYIKYEYFEKI